MLNLFKYIDELEKRVRVIEEELLRYDFGYDPVETLQRRFKEKEGFDIWKVKFAMDKPDKPNSEELHAQHWSGKGHTDRYGS